MYGKKIGSLVKTKKKQKGGGGGRKKRWLIFFPLKERYDLNKKRIKSDIYNHYQIKTNK